MFKAIKKFFQGDQRPIEREVSIEGLGLFTYIDEEENWKLPANRSGEIDILIEGDWAEEQEVIKPNPQLIDQAKLIRLNPLKFKEKLFTFVDSVDVIESGKKDELKNRNIEAIRLFIDKAGREFGTLSFDCTNDRHYFVDFLDGEPVMLGCDG